MSAPKYVHGIWFVGNSTGDWMAKLFKDDGRWVLEYRFRYYHPTDGDPFEGLDKKNWYGFQAEDDSDESLAKWLAVIEQLIPVVQGRYGTKADFVDLRCMEDDHRFIQELSKHSWCHVKSVSPEEFARLEERQAAKRKAHETN